MWGRLVGTSNKARIKACISGFLAGVFDCFVPTIQKKVKHGYQFVFILYLAVSNDVKTTCQLNTKVLAGSLEKLTYCLTFQKLETWGAGLPIPLPQSTPVHLLI
jgi:hypothetical protein